MEVANTILEQIKYLTPKMVFWSWGASKFQAVGENKIEGIGGDYLGALMFYVRGKNHTGHVIVSLTPNDTYKVTIGRVVKGVIKVKKQVEEVYFDQLPEILDELIEKQSNYAY